VKNKDRTPSKIKERRGKISKLINNIKKNRGRRYT
jgi:hypothetical protein